jgi:hypothetical protein
VDKTLPSLPAPHQRRECEHTGIAAAVLPLGGYLADEAGCAGDEDVGFWYVWEVRVEFWDFGALGWGREWGVCLGLGSEAQEGEGEDEVRGRGRGEGDGGGDGDSVTIAWKGGSGQKIDR